MGFISTGIKSIGGTLGSQYKDAIICEDMGNEILMIKKSGKKGVIRQGSMIVVSPGQVAVMVDNGQIIDAVAEGGVYEYDSNTAPTFFGGDFGTIFSEMWQRFSFGGGTWLDQAIYFINAKEIMDNGFGTPSPVPYRDWERCVSNARTGGLTPMRIDIRCHGTYTFRVVNPAEFMFKVGGTAQIFRKDDLAQQMKNEIVGMLQSVLNSLCDEEHKVFPLMLPQKSEEIMQIMKSRNFDEQIKNRGIVIESMQILSVTPDNASKEKMDKYDVSGDFAFQQAELTGALRDAANNSAGAGVGFMNLNMMGTAQGTVLGGGQTPVMQGQGAAPRQTQQQAGATVVCPKCSTPGSGKFCGNCGGELPNVKFCSNCGEKASGKFCQNCGQEVK